VGVESTTCLPNGPSVLKLGVGLGKGSTGEGGLGWLCGLGGGSGSGGRGGWRSTKEARRGGLRRLRSQAREQRSRCGRLYCLHGLSLLRLWRRFGSTEIAKATKAH
jgi:hypothetical protein